MKILLFLLAFAFGSEWLFFRQVSFPALVDELLHYRVVYIGEVHDNEEIHEIQLKVIKALYERDKRLVIAMEMFQQPFQEFLDLYVEGEISEEEMLRKTEYRKRWGMREELYRDIWRFASRHGIPLVALNVPPELIQEVRKKGIRNVRSVYLPPRIVFPPPEYREFLLKQARKHSHKVDEKRFIEVQTLWDNAMAYKILKLLFLYPEHRIVVIVGKGHVWRGYGIPYVLSKLMPSVKQAILYPVEEEKFFNKFTLSPK
ncbi:MAG: ChaN family lipoprotein [Aquificae bacterium]|nr:ChaN family lipoprotein [Aquificota bacterium]